MHLGFDFSYNHLGGRWRLPGGWDTHTFPDVAMFDWIARTAERGCLDMLFSGDGTGVPDTWRGSRDAAVEWGISFPRQDLSPYMVAMSRVTQHIGFGLTYSSSFMHPYYIARLMNSLDHITGGRIAMNLVARTRPADFANYGYDGLMGHADRYERMEEFVDVCRKLWDATEADAVIWDRTSGRVAEPVEGACDVARRAVLQGGGAAEHAALAAGPAGADPGGRVAARHPGVGLCGGPRVRAGHGARRRR